MNRLLIIFIWLFTVAVSYWFGLTQKFESNERAVLSNHGSKLIKSNDAKIISQPKLAIKPSNSTEVDYSISTENQLPRVESFSETTLVDRLSSGNPVVRMQAFAELLKNPTENNINEAI